MISAHFRFDIISISFKYLLFVSNICMFGLQTLNVICGLIRARV